MLFRRLPIRGSDFASAIHRRGGWLLALAFWLFAYLLFTFSRSLRLDLPPEAISPFRLVITGLGALIYRLVIAFIEASKGRRSMLLLAMLLSIPASAFILLARLALEDWLDPAGLAVTDQLRWSIIWAGYFGAWVGGFAILTLPAATATVEPAVRDEPAEPEALWIDHHGRSERVALDAIRWVQAEGNYVRVHANGRSGLLRMSMARMEERLRPHGFRRVHRSALCRPADIASIIRRPSGAYMAQLIHGDEVPVSREAAGGLRQADRDGAETEQASGS